MKHVIVDTDLAMGTPKADIDDGFALALAVADPHLEVDMVTAVNGNTTVDQAMRLAPELMKALGIPTTPLYRGASSGLLRRPGKEMSPAEREPGPSSRADAPERIIDHVLANPGQITIIALGPLTNIALALLLEPSIARAVHEIVIMGGVFQHTTGQGSMPGEFNVWVDPEAADLVMHSSVPQRWVGLDVTLQVRLTMSDAIALRDSGTAFASSAGRAAVDWINHLQDRWPGDTEVAEPSCAMHDPLAVAAVAHPEFLTWRAASVSAVGSPESVRGVITADLLRGANPPPPNCEIATEVDSQAFLPYMFTSLNSLS